MKSTAAKGPIVKIIRILPGKRLEKTPPIRLVRGNNHRIVFESPDGDALVYFKERKSCFHGPETFFVARGHSFAIGPLLPRPRLRKVSFGVVLIDRKGRLHGVDPGFIIEDPPGGGDECEVFEIVIPR